MIKQDVARLHVAMHDTVRVGEMERVRNGRRQRRCLVEGESRLVHLPGKVASFNETRDHEAEAVVTATQVVDRHDIRMIETGDGARFTQIRIGVLAPRQAVWVRNLDRHVPLQLLIAAEVDGPKSARTDLALHAVAAEILGAIGQRRSQAQLRIAGSGDKTPRERAAFRSAAAGQIPLRPEAARPPPDRPEWSNAPDNVRRGPIRPPSIASAGPPRPVREALLGARARRRARSRPRWAARPPAMPPRSGQRSDCEPYRSIESLRGEFYEAATCSLPKYAKPGPKLIPARKHRA